jgi:hypothetical protein
MPPVERYDLLPFSNLCPSKYDRLDRIYAHKDAPPIPQERMEHLRGIALGCGLTNVVIQGLTAKAK